MGCTIRTLQRTNVISDVLRKHWLFDGVDRNALECAVGQFELVDVLPLETVVNQGAPGNSVFVLKTGTVDVLVTGTFVQHTFPAVTSSVSSRSCTTLTPPRAAQIRASLLSPSSSNTFPVD